jgi:adenine-specific DNA-methyltransferase
MPTLNWIGKDKVIKHHHDVPFRVLEKQYDFNPTPDPSPHREGSMIVHGDNLEALKALLPYYEGKIKCIYIDPPYNTGNEGWVYNDNVNDPKIKRWLGKVVGKEAEDLTRHDKWLCMMYPRLKLLHKLLAPDGAIFVSIDDNEQASIKLLIDEIWGLGNFIAAVICVNNPKGRSDDKYIATAHETLLVYRKTINTKLSGFRPELKITKRYNKTDEEGKKYREIDLRKTGDSDLREDRPNMFYPFFYDEKSKKLLVDNLNLETPAGFIRILPMKSDILEGRWRWGIETAKEQIGKLIPKYMPAKQ